MPHFAQTAFSQPAVIKEILYPGAPPGERRRSLDLYLPTPSASRPPLLIFVHGGFWMLDDDTFRIGASLAETLAKDGVAVALLRYRLAPGHSHPTQAEDVAAGVALLVGAAERYGYDRKRIFLAGHSAGAHLASLVALDPTYLGRTQVQPQSLAGVIAFSGLYDLAPSWKIGENQKFATEQAFGRDLKLLKQASPVSHARGAASPFLVLSAAQDFPGFAIDARRFADALRRAGHARVQQYMVGKLDHFSLVNLASPGNPLRGAVLDFIGVRSLSPQLADWAEANKRWAEPPFTTLPFWQHKSLIRAHPIDDRFVRMLSIVYRERRFELQAWPLQQYFAIDMFAYLNALPKAAAGTGDFVVISNVRGEQQVWHRSTIEPYRPVIVVGIDDERNLFRFKTFYHMLAEYSWKPTAKTPLLAMTLGAFVYFQKPPPPSLQAQSWHFGLTTDSFHRLRDDPLQAVKDVPPAVYDALTFQNGCVYCHSFRSVGSRSHHVNALTGKPQSGFALPLEDYPPEVWKAFIFDQETVAKKMGAFPNLVRENARAALFDLVNLSRQSESARRKQ